MRRKRPSRRRVKARFLRYHPITMEDIYNYRLEGFIAGRYEMIRPMVIRRYFKPIRVVLEEISSENLRMAFLGEA